MKKGFTLIELLAVIVILAIIALIATPIVLNIINDTKASAVLRSAEFYLDGVETAIATSVLDNNKIQDGTYNIMSNGDICIGTLTDDSNNPCTGKPLEVEIDGEKPTNGKIKIKDGKIAKVDMAISNKEVWTDTFTGKIEHKLEPGLYDENDNLIASWEELETDYGLNLKDTDYNNNATDIIEQFDNASKLVISDKVETIGFYAFRACTNLTEIIIPDSVKNITRRAFYGCTNLKSITLPEEVTSIGDMTFYLCTSLTEITIPDSVTSIDATAFDSCEKLETINYNKENVSGYPWGAPNAKLETSF